ncbi:hypothetical protein CP980_34660 [Streptomyces vinaceus]|uniref:Carrier domain-containing protein n=1 Tax=Streptomyces vinaceus TaxID=1960 RepID=A0A5J6JI55_STRVI|nr:phosphopantetheine-binding protein [Streptomyces vinaceus]QEV49491.1 hypothetical protein CP980_34660 [Streptomyces vinaceus]
MIRGAFVTLPAFPLTANGKTDRRRLPAPGSAGRTPTAGYEAPRGPVETALTEVFAQVLGHERVGAPDNWFALGGDSIRSLQVLARIRERGLDLTVADLMSSSTARASPRTSPPGTGPGQQVRIARPGSRAGPVAGSRARRGRVD